MGRSKRPGNKLATLTIGRLAKKAGVNVETVRYYQRIGLIEQPVTPVSGFRVYPVQFIEDIRFIKRAQCLGFSLKEIAELLKIGDGSCVAVRKKAEKKRDKISRQIADLKILQATLDALIGRCKQGKNNGHCAIVESLLGKR